MVILLSNGYFVEIDKLNHTLKQNCKGTDKAGNEKEYEKTHGYFSNIDSAIERYLKLNQNDLMADCSVKMHQYLELVKKANEQAVQAVKAIVEVQK